MTAEIKLAVCKTCEHYWQRKDYAVCKKCGCPLQWKAQLKGGKCPIGRW